MNTKTIVKAALPVVTTAVTTAATAWVVKKTRLPAIATPVISIAIGGVVTKLAQRIG